MKSRALGSLGVLVGLALQGCDSDPQPTPSRATDAAALSDVSAPSDASGIAATYCRIEACTRPECPVPAGAAWGQCNVELTLRSNDCRTATPTAPDVQLCACGFGRLSQSCQQLLAQRLACLAPLCP